jgi:hypothetical protein
MSSRICKLVFTLGLAAFGSLLTACAAPAPMITVPVRIHVTNQTAEHVTIRWRDNKISGESDPIAPGSTADVNASFTNRGAGDLRLEVIGSVGQTIRSKRFDAEILRAAGYSRKLIVTDSRIAAARP